jgi:hypothetical protein
MYLDGDAISATIDDSRDLDDKLPDIHAEILRFLRANLTAGCSVILDFAVNDATRNYFLDNMRDIEFTPHWFLLKPDIKKVLSSSKSRPELNDWEIERIDYHYYRSDLMKTELVQVIDSTKQTADETAGEVYRVIERYKK